MYMSYKTSQKKSSYLHTLYTNTDITVHLDADEFTCNWLFQQTAL